MNGDIIRQLDALGLTPSQIAGVVDILGAADEARLSKGRDRVRRHREARNGTKREETLGNVTSVTGSFLPSSLPPGPPNPTTNLSPEPPIVPQKSTPKPAKSQPLAERIFLLQPICEGRRKSARPDVATALTAALKRGGEPGEILTACEAFYRLPASTKDGGRFANGAAVILNNDRWRDFLPSPEPPAEVSEGERAWRIEHYRSTREWKPGWGERPRDAA